MKIKNNNNSVVRLTFQQYNNNANFVEFIFDDLQGYDFSNVVVELIFSIAGKSTMMSSLFSNNVGLEVQPERLVVKWNVTGQTTFVEGTHKLQVRLRIPENNGKLIGDDSGLIAYSETLSFTVKDSLEVDDVVVAENGSLLIEMMNKIDAFEKEVNNKLDEIKVGVSSETRKRVYVMFGEDGLNFNVPELEMYDTTTMQVYAMGARLFTDDYTISGSTFTLTTEPLDENQYLDFVFREVI